MWAVWTGNEQTVPLFGSQVVAMEHKAKSLGIGGKMRYVYPNGHNYGLDGGPISTIKQVRKTSLLCSLMLEAECLPRQARDKHRKI